MDTPEPTNETPPATPPPRKQRLCELVADCVAAQEEEANLAAIDEAASADPAFSKRKGESNFGKRVSARLQQALR